MDKYERASLMSTINLSKTNYSSFSDISKLINDCLMK